LNAERKATPLTQLGASPLLGTDRQQDGIVVLFKLLETDVAADPGIHMDIYAHIDDALVLAIHDITRHAVAGDAVTCHATEFGTLVEYRGTMTAASQLVGGGHASHTATDDGDFFTGFMFRLLKIQTFLQGMVADELFDRIDANKVFDLVAVAAFLAGSRANATHHGGERVGRGGAPEGVFLPRHAIRRFLDATHDLQPATDILTGRATSLAGRGFVYIGRTLVGGVLVENVF